MRVVIAVMNVPLLGFFLSLRDIAARSIVLQKHNYDNRYGVMLLYWFVVSNLEAVSGRDQLLL